jgi:hypothetical protein
LPRPEGLKRPTRSSKVRCPPSGPGRARRSAAPSSGSGSLRIHASRLPWCDAVLLPHQRGEHRCVLITAGTGASRQGDEVSK